MSDLRTELMDIRGIGESKADTIIDTLDNHTMENIEDGVTEICGQKTESGFCTYPASDCPDHDGKDTSVVKELLEEALAYYQQGDYEHTKEHVEEAIEEL